MSELTQSTAQQWQAFFQEWPASIPSRGIVTNSLNEQMPFKGFMLKGTMILLERNNPDAMGGRYILMNFSSIDSVKLVDPLKETDATAAGFVGKFAKM
ncbi:hypothetical protein [Bythopirellula polymerisocia]|uniref:Uncharacterized protein n=1 Tax=Bythopirellula polymerisocia TaxID=2528003 RepID=A0A5C6CV03_9BACT|nr:hypothetical protein [Bythopirellula polymerisocia]TWU27494.1 hypothetical protein Pla144_22680 [Bythopirellula polymerisocia]